MGIRHGAPECVPRTAVQTSHSNPAYARVHCDRLITWRPPMSEDCVALAQNGAVSTPAGSRLNRRRTYGLILEKRTPCAPAPGDVLIPVRARGGVFLRDREAGAFRRAAPNSSEDTIPPPRSLRTYRLRCWCSADAGSGRRTLNPGPASIFHQGCASTK